MRANQKQKKPQGFWAKTFQHFPIVAGAILGLLVLVYVFTNENGLPLYFQMLEKENALKRQTQQLEMSNHSLGESIHSLQHDPSELEKLARDQLGMVREGEVVYQFVEPKSDASP
ncbi:MAG: septum formation initiator family protein [Nitrospirales bacterium]|nr:septum formation initiator family protein [Nitrospirales bacterium]